MMKAVVDGTNEYMQNYYKLHYSTVLTAQYKNVNQSHYRPKVPRGFQEVKVPRLHDSDPEWW